MLASKIFHNGSVLTMDESLPEAQAIALCGENIVAIGRDEDILNLSGPGTISFDLRGCTLLPGIIDTHCHFFQYGLRAQGVDVSAHGGVKTIGELLRRVEAEVARRKPKEWIRAANYYQYALSENRHPTIEELDRVSPDNPLVLYHSSGHAYMANSLALSRAGIDVETPDPPGGVIERIDGRLTGLLKEDAMDYIRRVNRYTPEEISEALRISNAHYSRHGITTVCDMGELDGQGEEATRLLLVEVAKGNVKVKISIGVVGGQDKERQGNILLRTGLTTGFGNHGVSIGPYKMFLDGTTEVATAAVDEPYAGDPTNTGLLCIPIDVFEELMREARKKGWQVSVHVMGDRAARIALDVIERVEKSMDMTSPYLYPFGQFPYRLEHIWYIDPAEIPRLVDLKVQPILNPIFLSEGTEIASEFIGSDVRKDRSGLIGSFFRNGLPVAAGSDCPFSLVNPLLGIEYAIMRSPRNGRPGNVNECIDLNQALRMYTYNGALALGQESYKGSLRQGKIGDLTILSENLMEVEPRQISDVQVKATLVDGEFVYQGTDF